MMIIVKLVTFLFLEMNHLIFQTSNQMLPHKYEHIFGQFSFAGLQLDLILYISLLIIIMGSLIPFKLPAHVKNTHVFLCITD